MKKRLINVLLVLLILCLFSSVAYAENDDATGAEQPEQQETQAPSDEPDDEPVTEPAESAAPEPTAATSQNGNASAAEDYGRVDLVLYVYNSNGTPASGCSVKIDETIQKTNNEGRASFPDLTVERHNLSISDGDGATHSVLLYMSRGNSTQSTGVAQDGTCGLDIARGISQVYMTIDLNRSLGIKLSENKPTPPSVSPSASTAASASGAGLIIPSSNSDTQYQTKEIYATFNDEDGKGINKLRVWVDIDDGDSIEKDTNSSGRAQFDSIPYGGSHWSFNEDYEGFDFELRKGVQTGIISGEGDNLSVSASPRAQRIYLTFTQSGDDFILEEATESSGGMPIIFLIIIIAVIVIGVAITVAVVKKRAGKQVNPNTNNSINNINYADRTTPRSTGGSNKLNDNSIQAKKSERDFDDRYRM